MPDPRVLERVLLRVHQHVQAEHRLDERGGCDVDEAVRRLRDPNADADVLILSSAKELRQPIVAA
jgi:hypothetical protein